MSDALKDCPFCGGKMVAFGYLVRHHGETDTRCPLIGLRLPLDVWNRRANDQFEETLVKIHALGWAGAHHRDWESLARENGKRIVEMTEIARAALFLPDGTPRRMR